MRVEFLLEEVSMKNALEVLLPKILPQGFKLNENCFLRPHNGKSDLEKSIPKKIKAFSSFGEETKIVVLQDQDSNDCKTLKRRLRELCEENGGRHFLIRIACKELESWYLGDLNAVQQVYPRFKAGRHCNKSKYRNPDLCQASDELKKLIPEFQKGFASREIPKHMTIEMNTSPSFKQFVEGLKKFLT